MRTFTLVPSHLAVHVGPRDDQLVGIVTVVGTGDFEEAIIELVLDAPMMAGLEASLGEARQLLRHTPATRLTCGASPLTLAELSSMQPNAPRTGLCAGRQRSRSPTGASSTPPPPASSPHHHAPTTPAGYKQRS